MDIWIFSKFNKFEAIWNSVPCITMKFIKKLYTDTLLKNLMVTSGNLLLIAQNHENLTKI